MASSPSFKTPGTLIVRAPSRRLKDGQVTHIARADGISYELARQEWEEYVSVFASAGWKVREVEVAEECPDCVFVEDTLVMFGNTAVLTCPGTPSRQPEITAVAQLVSEFEQFTVHSITEPATLDGGDILKIGMDVYVGRGGRTNGDGIRQLRHIVTPLGYTVHPVPVTKALHLKSAVTALPDGTVIGYEPIVDDARFFPRFMPVPEEHGVAVVVLSDSHLLMSSDAPKTTELLRSLGYEVTTVGITQFEALEGCVTCLSVRVRS